MRIGDLLQRNKETQNLPSISPKSSQAIECINKYIDKVNFLKLFNPDMQYKYCKNLDRCYSGSAPTLSVVSEAFGEDVATSWIAIMVRDLSEFAGCKDKLSLSQINHLERLVMLNFGYMKVTELMHFFVMFKSGKFGKFYGAVDGLVIMEALQDFAKMRRDKINEIETRRHKEEKERADREHAKRAITYQEYQELKWLFNMGYEPWRIKKELEEQRKANK